MGTTSAEQQWKHFNYWYEQWRCEYIDWFWNSKECHFSAGKCYESGSHQLDWNFCLVSRKTSCCHCHWSHLILHPQSKLSHHLLELLMWWSQLLVGEQRSSAFLAPDCRVRPVRLLDIPHLHRRVRDGHRHDIPLLLRGQRQERWNQQALLYEPSMEKN